jgi:alanine racemase
MKTLLSASPMTAAPTTTKPLLTVDLDAIAANTRFFAACSPSELIAVVKADGYGHGALDAARTALANGATRLGVTSIEEALAIRAAGITAPIISWLNHPGADFQLAVDERVDIAVPSAEHLRSIVRASGMARVHLQLDTGMARDGCEPNAWIELCSLARKAELEGNIRVVGVMGHLGDADRPGAASNRHGLAMFEWGIDVARLSGLRPSLTHLAATCAALTMPGARFSACRVGAGLFGIDLSRTAQLQSPMTLTAPVVAVRHVAIGAPVGYGGDWLAPRSTRLGLVGLGYADGLPRSSSGKAEVLVNGRRHAVVGRMSMDQFVIDLGDRGAAVGDTVVVFGPGSAGEPTVAEWARWSGTIEHEIVTRVGARVPRRVIAATNGPVGARDRMGSAA